MADPIREAISALEEGKQGLQTALSTFEDSLEGVDQEVRDRCVASFEDAVQSVSSKIDQEINKLEEALSH